MYQKLMQAVGHNFKLALYPAEWFERLDLRHTQDNLLYKTIITLPKRHPITVIDILVVAQKIATGN